MEVKDLEMLLDSMHNTAVYVIREDNHQILYFNKRVRDVAPDVTLGVVCHELWSEPCSHCPLNRIGERTDSHSIIYDSPFGKMVDMSAARITWQENIPAFLITVRPHAEAASHTYSKIFRANLTTNTYEVIQTNEEDIIPSNPDISLSEWGNHLMQSGNIYISDIERFRKFIDLDNLRKELRSDNNMAIYTYRRKSEQGFRWHTMEIVPDYDYSEDNQAVMIYVKDVHDVRHEGMELEESVIRNQEIIHSLGEQNFGIYMIDLQSGMLHPIRVSEDVEKLVSAGIHEWDEVLSKMIPLFHSDYRSELLKKYSLKSLQEALAKGEKKTELLCQRMINGDYHYVSTITHFHQEPSGSYAILAIQDVDTYTRREIKHSQNDRRMAVIIQSRYNVLNRLSLDTGICERIYLDNLDESDKVYTGDYDAYIKEAAKHSIYEEDVAAFLDTLSLDSLRKKASEVENYAEFTFQYRIKGASLTWVEAQVFFIWQDDTIMVNILGRDITLEKQREAKYNAEKRERSDIIASLSSLYFATYYFDIDSDTFRIVTQQNEVGDILGNEVNASEALRTYAEHFVHPDYREEYLSTLSAKNLRDKLSKEHPFLAIEYRRIRKAGDSFENNGWVRATLILSEEENGVPKKALYVAQDITETKQKEEMEQNALREACEAAIHANASKSEFLSRMSHDIRTPMNAIIGMTAIAGTHLDDSERVKDCLNKITVSSKHLLSLINEVLDMSKIESGTINLAEEEFNLSDLIENLLTMIRPSIEAKQQHLDCHISNVEHEDLVGDVLRLQQVFMNIAGNAVKYTPVGGKLDISISEKTSKSYGYGCYEFVFRDSGIGMSEEYIKTIFDPFSRAEDSRVSKIEGTGLGMTIALNIVRMMNGDIQVESREGEGSQFTVTVFLKQQNTNLPDMAQLVNLPVLVADDDVSACEAACELLDSLGMKSEYVLGGKDAVARVSKAHEAKEDFFAVILDWKMPDMDGIETTKEIRKIVGPEVPIIILSAYDWSNVEAEARSAGINGFISKPLFKSRLVYLFKKIADGKHIEKAAAPEISYDQIFENKRILLAEDNDLNREIAEEIIGSTGITVESVTDGKQALDKFLEMGANYYNLILMDIQMPVMNGYESTEAIRSSGQEDAERIPIIAMTANAFMEDVIASKQAGMNEHITKPLQINQLMDCIKRWI